MNISMFGVLSVHDGVRTFEGRAIGGAKPRGLLELLLLARGRAVSKDALADALWGGTGNPPVDAARTLEHYICVLRRKLCTDADIARLVFVTGPNSYRLDPAHVTIDVDVFDALLRQAEQADPEQRRELLTEAVGIAASDLLEDSPYAAWAQIDRDMYRDRVARAHLWLAGDSILDGEMHMALRHCEDALRFAPYSEQAFRLMMVANYSLGHDDLARSTYRRCCAVLEAGLGLDPTSATSDLAGAIDAGAPISEVIALSPSVLV
ncbi:MAG: hypothetical protein RJA49_1629 [Actinomycetota bacterium]